MKLKSLVFGATVMTCTYSCITAMPENDFKIDPSTGVQYHFYKQSKKGVKPAMGEYAMVTLLWKDNKDSVFMDTRKAYPSYNGEIRMPVKKTFNGCLEEGMTLMSVGDSAKFKISTDSLYLRSFGQKSLPGYVRAGSSMFFTVKLDKIETQQEVDKENAEAIKKQQDIIASLKKSEGDTIRKFLKNTNPKLRAFYFDSLYILRDTMTISGGKKIEEGDSVELGFVGMLTNGKVFQQAGTDASKPSFKFIYGHNASLIRGWIDVLAFMHEGEDFWMLLPSSMAYGPNAAGPMILPYSPLLYHIHIVRVKVNHS